MTHRFDSGGQSVPLGAREAVRVGDTVRPWSRPIQALLEHMRSAEFLAAPAALGVDEEGREVMQWVESDAGVEPVTPAVASDHALAEAARLIRRFHDGSETFQWDAGGWNPLVADPSESDEVICHNELSTYNLVYREADPIALIDWELASPGSRLWDLAYACVWLGPLHTPAYCESAGWGQVDYARRLRLFCDSYGLDQTRHDLLDVVFERLARNREQLRLWAAQGILDPAAEHLRLDADSAHIALYRSELERALA